MNTKMLKVENELKETLGWHEVNNDVEIDDVTKKFRKIN